MTAIHGLSSRQLTAPSSVPYRRVAEKQSDLNMRHPEKVTNDQPWSESPNVRPETTAPSGAGTRERSTRRRRRQW